MKKFFKIKTQSVHDLHGKKYGVIISFNDFEMLMEELEIETQTK